MELENKIKLLSKFHAHEPLKDAWNFVSQLCFSPDSTKLLVVSASHKQLKIMDVESGTCLHTVEGHASEVKCCAWSPNGDYIATGSAPDEKGVKIWDAKTLQCIHTMNEASFGISACDFSPNSEELITGTTGWEIHIWAVKTGTLIKTLERTHGDDIRYCVYSRNGELILSCADKTVRLWNKESGECIKTFQSTDGVLSCSFSLDEKRVFSGGRDMVCKIWSIETGECLVTTAKHEGLVGIVNMNRFLVGDYFLSTSIYAMQIWNGTTGECVAILKGDDMDRALEAANKMAEDFSKGGFNTIVSLFFPDPTKSMPISGRCAVSPNGRRIAGAWNDVSFICDTSSILK